MAEAIYTRVAAANYCGLKPITFYGHYRRGHVRSIKDLKTHALYFSKSALDEFIASYLPKNIIR